LEVAGNTLEGSISFCEQGNFGDRLWRWETALTHSSFKPDQRVKAGFAQVASKTIPPPKRSDLERKKPIVILRVCFQLLDSICLISEVNLKARSMYLQKGAIRSKQYNE
jgi:hypothetical protein